MTLPAGWIDNFPAPERALGDYTGDHTANWEAGLGGAVGHQPGGTNNPAGDLGLVPIMSITAANAGPLGL